MTAVVRGIIVEGGINDLLNQQQKKSLWNPVSHVTPLLPHLCVKTDEMQETARGF